MNYKKISLFLKNELFDKINSIFNQIMYIIVIICLISSFIFAYYHNNYEIIFLNIGFIFFIISKFEGYFNFIIPFILITIIYKDGSLLNYGIILILSLIMYHIILKTYEVIILKESDKK